MKISFNELRSIKHQLPTGSIQKIADQLNLEQQTVRNYFGAAKYQDGKVVGHHVQAGPDGGIVNLERTDILELAKSLIPERQASMV